MPLRKKMLTVAIIWGHNHADHSPFMSLWMRSTPCQCLHCNHPLTAVGMVERGDPAPSAGDFTVCLYCGHLMVFLADLTVRGPSDSEMLEIAGDRELLQVQAFREAFRKWKQEHEQKAKS